MFMLNESMAWTCLFISKGIPVAEMLDLDAMYAYVNKTVYVVSLHNWIEKQNIKFIPENITELIAALRNEPGKTFGYPEVEN